MARLLTLSVETCSVTLAYSLGAMILFLTKPEQFYFLILLAPLGQIMALVCVATLMSRPSIANELAQDQTMGVGPQQIDQFASTAPTSIAKPVLKRIMKREEQRQPLQVQMTTTVQQTASQTDGLSSWSEKDRIQEEPRRFNRHDDVESQSTLASNRGEEKGGSRKGSRATETRGEGDEIAIAEALSPNGGLHEAVPDVAPRPGRRVEWQTTPGAPFTETDATGLAFDLLNAGDYPHKTGAWTRN